MISSFQELIVRRQRHSGGACSFSNVIHTAFQGAVKAAPTATNIKFCPSQAPLSLQVTLLCSLWHLPKLHQWLVPQPHHRHLVHRPQWRCPHPCLLRCPLVEGLLGDFQESSSNPQDWLQHWLELSYVKYIGWASAIYIYIFFFYSVINYKLFYFIYCPSGREQPTRVWQQEWLQQVQWGQRWWRRRTDAGDECLISSQVNLYKQHSKLILHYLFIFILIFLVPSLVNITSIRKRSFLFLRRKASEKPDEVSPQNMERVGMFWVCAVVRWCIFLSCRMTLVAEVSRTPQVQNTVFRKSGAGDEMIWQGRVLVTWCLLCASPDAVKKPWERSNSAEKSSLVSRSEDFNRNQHRCGFEDISTEIFIVTRVSFAFQSEASWQHQWSRHRVWPDETGRC